MKLNFANLYFTLSNHDTRCNPPGIKIDIVAKRCVICHLKAWTLLIIVKLFNASTEKSTDELYRVFKSSEAGMDFKIARSISLSGVRRLKIISREHGNKFLLVSSAAQATLY